MKKILLNMKTVGLMAIVAGALTFNSCNTVKCNEPKDDNYESTQNECNEDATTGKFVGTFNVSEICTSGNDSYTITITQSSTTDYTILINNFYNTFTTAITANVSQSSLTIPSQTIGSITVSGSGSISGNNLTLSYTLTDGTNSDSCNVTATRQ